MVWFTHGFVLLVGFVTGLLVGRRNPKIADAAQGLADKVKK